ncbi:MAG TPA: transketolase [Pyrinomonadaceae bacterium]|nr:transketolase [Chloracidobacterium sp.]MBP9934272.1 transketolase [Pyrinomonadaceae bacterium]MBK7801531.1 transketolase [Chloracidobacterium sp.]MBK9436848.1 transketolase [Chloracidobacterium sp.]MBL0241841.1 transketolase [Chloracidobacterium sp.]
MTTAKTDIDQLCINTIRTLSLDAIQKANSGHPGLPLGMAPAAYVLWTKFLRHNPKNPKWFGRDRFLLSAGHGSMLIYSLLHLTGYDLSLDDIKQFRQLHSKTPGHPENVLTPGVEITTGPLGQGFANGVGMGIAQAHLAAKFNVKGSKVVDNYIYCICSDGDLMEGVSYEAASLAGHLKLGNLIYLYDDNRITIDGSTDLAFTEDVTKRFEAAGWHVSEVADGNDIKAIERAIKEAHKIKNQPKIIRVKTIIGYGMPKQGTSKAHSDAPGVDAVKETKRNLGWPEDKSFYIPKEASAHFRTAIKNGAAFEKDWNALVKQYEKADPELGAAFVSIRSSSLPDGWERSLPKFEGTEAKATRAYSGEVINAIADSLPSLIGGSADLKPSNNTYINSSADIQPGTYANRNIHYGIREHAMGAAMNGMALFGSVIPFGGTFQTFSDYMRPAIRLAALSDTQTIFVFTHDSIGLGEDGPTHQSVEHLAAMRAIPNLAVIRPCDAHETREAWRAAIKRQHAPTAFALSRQKVALIDRKKFADAKGLHKGAYVLAEAETKAGKATAPKLIIIATGSEVGLAMEAREHLNAAGTPTRVVSMPCWEFFDAQTQKYRDEVLPPKVTARLAVEAGVSQGWHKYVGDKGDILAVDKFGTSAPAEDVFRAYGFTLQNVISKAKALI